MTPDDFAARTAGDLFPGEILLLGRVWPAAYEAVVDLLLLIDQGKLAPTTSDLDLPLPTLVQQHAIHEEI